MEQQKREGKTMTAEKIIESLKFTATEADAERGKGGRPRKLETVEEFREVAERYINYIKDRALDGVRLVPDIEGFCAFAGISRETLNNWETARPGAYSDTIKIFKNTIAAYKKQLAFNGEIPRLVSGLHSAGTLPSDPPDLAPIPRAASL
jgi:hypothetical protein